MKLAKPKGQISRAEFKLEELFRTGAVDWMDAVPPAMVEEFRKMPGVTTTQAPKGAEPGRLMRIALASGAAFLAAQLLDVTVFEMQPKAGGLNEYGIAAYKMTNDFAQREVDFILSVGGITVDATYLAPLGDFTGFSDPTKGKEAAAVDEVVRHH